MLILSGFAYTLFERLRAHLKKTPFEQMSASDLRLKLIKVERGHHTQHPTHTRVDE